jgi:hypothetical protein
MQVEVTPLTQVNPGGRVICKKTDRIIVLFGVLTEGTVKTTAF